MRIYADNPARVARQVLADLVIGCWLLAALAVPAVVGVTLWRLGDRITGVVGQTNAAVGQLRTSADTAAGVPFVGSDVAAPLRTLAGTVASVTADLGGDTVSVHRAAVIYAVTAGLLAAVAPIVVWWLIRGRWVKAARRVRGALSEDDLQALACAAAATSSLRTLRRLPPGTVLAWAAGDIGSRRELAFLQLRTLGLFPPRAQRPR